MLGNSVAGGPIGGQTNVQLRNEHFSYIITWSEPLISMTRFIQLLSLFQVFTFSIHRSHVVTKICFLNLFNQFININTSRSLSHFLESRKKKERMTRVSFLHVENSSLSVHSNNFIFTFIASIDTKWVIINVFESFGSHHWTEHHKNNTQKTEHRQYNN